MVTDEEIRLINHAHGMLADWVATNQQVARLGQCHIRDIRHSAREDESRLKRTDAFLERLRLIIRSFAYRVGCDIEVWMGTPHAEFTEIYISPTVVLNDDELIDRGRHCGAYDDIPYRLETSFPAGDQRPSRSPVAATERAAIIAGCNH